MSQYILPNGRMTTNQEQYILDWGYVSQQIEQALGVEVIASNPGLQIADNDGDVATLPMWLVYKIIDLWKQQNKESNNE